MILDLRPHQETAVKKMHNGCILCGGVGVGKSHTAVGYYLENEAPKPVYVITTAKKRDKGDWQTLWAEVGMHKDPELTMGAVVIVDSWENIQRYKEVEGAFFVFDEQRLVGSGAWVKAFYTIAEHNRWIMLSATPGDNWLDYVPVFRANGFIKNITQFKEDHVVQRWTGRYHQVVGYRQVSKLVRWRNSLLVDMPYEKHTTRHSHDVLCTYDVALVKEMVKKRWHVYENRPLTDASELFRVMRKVVYSDASRIEAVRSLLTKHPKLIVFYNHDYELEILRTLSEKSIVEDQDAWSFLLSPEGMRENDSLIGTSTQTGRSTLATTSKVLLDTRSEIRSTTHEMSQSFEKPPWEKCSPNCQGCLNTKIQSQLGGPTSKTRKSSSKSHSESSSRSGSGTTLSISEEEKSSLETSQSEVAEATSGFQIAEWNGHKHQEIPKTDSWVYLVQYVAGAEAWESIETDAICFYSEPYSYKLWHQSHGRIDRLSTSFLDLHYYSLFAGSPIELAVRGSLKDKKSFNESAFVEMSGIWQK